MSFLGTWGLGLLLLGEKLNFRKILGALAGIVCIMCMSLA